MSTRILILKDGVITPTKSSADTNAVINSLGVVDLSSNQTIGGLKTFSGGLALPAVVGTSTGTIWRNVDNLEYKDSTNVTRITLNSAGNLSNLSNRQTSLNNLVGTQTANRVLKSDGTNMLLAQVGLTTDVVGILPVINGGANNSTYLDLTTTQTVAGLKTFSNTTQSTSTTTGGVVFGGGIGVVGNLNTGGFTSLGDNIAVKVKYITGTSGAAEGSIVTIPHGLTVSKIRAVSVMVEYSTNAYMPIMFVGQAGYCFGFYIAGSSIFVQNINLYGFSSINILSKPVHCIIEYIA